MTAAGPLDRIVETVRYTYRLRPGKRAEAALEAEWHGWDMKPKRGRGRCTLALEVRCHC
jgi:hypothetical protein